MSGYNLPPGVRRLPDEEESICEICNNEVSDCTCEPCPHCTVFGDPMCKINSGPGCKEDPDYPNPVYHKIERICEEEGWKLRVKPGTGIIEVKTLDGIVYDMTIPMVRE